MALKLVDKEFKKKWVEALRSGKYKQGKGSLRSSAGGVDRFCCLGVACDLMSMEKFPTVEWQVSDALGWEAVSCLDSGDRSDGILPSGAGPELFDGEERILGSNEWRDPTVVVSYPDGTQEIKHLSGLNDNGATFAEIADIIEAQL